MTAVRSSKTVPSLSSGSAIVGVLPSLVCWLQPAPLPAPPAPGRRGGRKPEGGGGVGNTAGGLGPDLDPPRRAAGVGPGLRHHPRAGPPGGAPAQPGVLGHREPLPPLGAGAGL